MKVVQVSEFKFELGQTVFYMQDNKVYSAPVISRIMVENLHAPEAWGVTKPSFGHERVQYATCHGIFHDSDLFATKEGLLLSL